eukprot:765042-Hanusia_phi.AAC.1
MDEMTVGVGTNGVSPSFYAQAALIDDFRFYNYVLTQFDVEQHYLPLYYPTGCPPVAYNPNPLYAFYPQLEASVDFPGVTNLNNGTSVPIATWDDAFRAMVASDKYATIVRVCYDCDLSAWLTFYKRILPVDPGWSISMNYLNAWSTDRSVLGVHYKMYTSEVDYLDGVPVGIMITPYVSPTAIDSNFSYLQFTYDSARAVSGQTSYTVTFSEDAVVDVLIVAGGGGGGQNLGGGGGGGGVIYAIGVTVPAGTYTALVGDGGVGAGASANINGYDSAIFGATASGGGRGGVGYGSTAQAATGGSGGGGNSVASGSATLGGKASFGSIAPSSLLVRSDYNGHANVGGNGRVGEYPDPWICGGGGGAGHPGFDGSSAITPDYGGDGIQINIDGNNYYWGGGGGGGLLVTVGPGNGGRGGGGGGGLALATTGYNCSTAGADGISVGGNGGCSTSSTGQNGGNGGTSTGGGGGGGSGNGGKGGNGGSGIIIIRYRTSIISTSGSAVSA